MNNLRYALIRYIPDMDRMEPINVGVILQGEGKIDFQLSPHAAKKKEIDTGTFQKWRTFFEAEIRGEAVPLFQPPKDSVRFLQNLARMCEHTVSITKPLVLQAPFGESFDTMLRSLYERLVAPVDQPRRQQSTRPTTKFRDLEEEKKFDKRGMKKHPYIPTDHQRWNAYRQVLNGENIVIDKVEVGIQLGRTADEIQKLASGVEAFLSRFLDDPLSAIPRRYVLIADELNEKFADQSDEDFHVMQDELDKVIGEVGRLGGRVLQKPDEVQELAESIDKKLPTVEELKQSNTAH